MPPVVGAMTSGEDLSIQEAAELLGVHYMTAYRYVRLGRLPARRVGQRWRISRAEVDAVAGSHQLDSKKQHPPQAASTANAPVDWSARLLNRALAHDLGGAWTVVETALVSGLSPMQVRSEVLVPTLRELGERWSRGQLSIGAERGASNICARLSVRLAQAEARPGRTKGTIVLGSPPSERHQLPTMLAADTFRANGYAVIDASGGIPIDSFIDLVAATDGAIAAAVSVTMLAHRQEAADLVAQLRARFPELTILVGGAGIDHATERFAGADIQAAVALDGVAQLDHLRTQRRA